jgi:hypothetical protein
MARMRRPSPSPGVSPMLLLSRPSLTCGGRKGQFWALEYDNEEALNDVDVEEVRHISPPAFPATFGGLSLYGQRAWELAVPGQLVKLCHWRAGVAFQSYKQPPFSRLSGCEANVSLSWAMVGNRVTAVLAAAGCGPGPTLVCTSTMVWPEAAPCRSQWRGSLRSKSHISRSEGGGLRWGVVGSGPLGWSSGWALLVSLDGEPAMVARSNLLSGLRPHLW